MVSLLHRVSVITVRSEDGDHCGNPFLVVAMAQILDVGKDVAVMTVDSRGSGPRGVSQRSVSVIKRVRDVRDLLLPDRGQDLVVGLEFVNADHLSPCFAALGMVDQHPVALELPADSGPVWINRAGKSLPGRVLPAEDTPLAGRIGFFGIRVDEIIRDFICKFRLYVDGKDLVGNAVPAVIIPFRELPLDFYKFAKTCTALPAPVAIKFRHTNCQSHIGYFIKIANYS